MRYFLWIFVLNIAHGQIQLNELMIDPNPVVKLPDAEYIELKNVSDSTVNLSTFSISDLSKKITLPDTNLVSGQIALIVKSSDGYLFKKPNIRLESWPSLNNTSDEIRLYRNNEVIDSIFYESSWYTQGGYSLERISINGFCSIKENWSSSISENGGTPGEENSIYTAIPIIKPQQIQSVSFNDSVRILFSEPFINNNFKLYIGNDDASFFKGIDYIIFESKLSGEHQVSITNLKNCVGEYYNIDTTLIFLEKPKTKDLVINEIMFNPIIGGEDYVEIANTTNKYLNLDEVVLSNLDNGELDEKKLLITHYLEPYQILCFTEDRDFTLSQYPKSDRNTIIEINSLPTFRNDSGTVVLSIKNDIIDKFSYSESLHHDLLEDTEGVSLERINYKENNWHSAASSHNYGTPGYSNSQYIEFSNLEIEIKPKLFTPDFDGNDDFTTISYNLDDIGYVGKIEIYNTIGQKIKTVISNSILETKGVFIWDGTSDNGERVTIGYYIVVFEFNKNGNTQKTKKTVVLGARLN